LFQAAEFEEGEAAGFLWRHALAEIVVDVELQVGGEFGVEVVVVASHVEEIEDPVES
jgi:hypothetical protein